MRRNENKILSSDENVQEAEVKNEGAKVVEIKLHFADYNCFEIEFPYEKNIIGEIRKIPGRTYKAESKRWSLPISRYHKLIGSVEELVGIKIIKSLTQKEINSAQIVIIDQIESYFKVQFPKNNTIQQLIKTFVFGMVKILKFHLHYVTKRFLGTRFS